MSTAQSGVFAAKLQQAMTDRGLTQATIASSLGMSQQGVSKWLTGETLPRHSTARRLDELLRLGPGTVGLWIAGADIDDPATVVEVVDVPSAIEADPALSADSRRMLLALYREAVTPQVEEMYVFAADGGSVKDEAAIIDAVKKAQNPTRRPSYTRPKGNKSG